jgi:hypothetical protein
MLGDEAGVRRAPVRTREDATGRVLAAEDIRPVIWQGLEAAAGVNIGRGCMSRGCWAHPSTMSWPATLLIQR